MSCCTLNAFFPKDGLSCESNLEKTETERVSENVRVKVSSIRPVFIQTVVRSQQRDEAHVSVCLVAWDTRPSLCTWLLNELLVSHLTRGGKKSRARMHTLKMDRWRGERSLVAESRFSQEPADLTEWT